jgi:microcin C transport system substrate-binding protein
MATHWAVASDNRTVYFRLDRDARWSDGKPVTARDYVFTWEMMRSPHIVDPYFNNVAEVYFESVDRIDDYTIRIIGKRPSWRPLYEYSLYPTPSHANVLDSTWVARSNNQFQLAVGPYVVSEAVRGQSVTFTRLPNWWGDRKHYCPSFRKSASSTTFGAVSSTSSLRTPHEHGMRSTPSRRCRTTG